MAPLWHKLAVCLELGNHVFFGKRDKTPMSAPEIRNAKLLCGQCPVRGECLSVGLDQEWGIWGGYTRPERERALVALGGEDEVLRAYELGTLDEIVTL